MSLSETTVWPAGPQDTVSWRYTLHADGRLDRSGFTPAEAARLDALWIITAALRRYLAAEPAEAVVACSVPRDYFDAVYAFTAAGFHERPEATGVAGAGTVAQTQGRLRAVWPRLDAAWRYLVAGGAEALERP